MTDNKSILTRANESISRGDIEGFLALCTEDITWKMVGEETIQGKDSVRKWMQRTYVSPPEFNVEKLMTDGDYVIASGEITVQDEKGHATHSEYCDVWRFKDGLMAELDAYAIEVQ